MANKKVAERRKAKTSNVVLVVLSIFLFSFIACMCWFFYKFQQVPEPLIYAVLGTGGGELLFMALIEMIKKKYGGDN